MIVFAEIDIYFFIECLKTINFLYLGEMNYFYKFISFNTTRLSFAGTVKGVDLSTVKPSGAVIPLTFNTAVPVFLIVNVFREYSDTVTVLNDKEAVNTYISFRC